MKDNVLFAPRPLPPRRLQGRCPGSWEPDHRAPWGPPHQPAWAPSSCGRGSLPGPPFPVCKRGCSRLPPGCGVRLGGGGVHTTTPASHTPSIHAALLFSYFCYFSCLPKSSFKEPWFPRRLMMMNARRQEHLASHCVWGACRPAPGPGSVLLSPRRDACVPGVLGTHRDDPQGPPRPRGWLGPGQAWPCGLPRKRQASVCLTPREGP